MIMQLKIYVFRFYFKNVLEKMLEACYFEFFYFFEIISLLLEESFFWKLFYSLIIVSEMVYFLYNIYYGFIKCRQN